jgi:dihydrofolate reductase
MILSAIVAATDNDVISKKGKIPWHMPADFARLKKITTGHPIIMGRKTHDSIGATLPGRINIVVSSNPGYKVHEGSILVHSLDEALYLPEVKNSEEAFIFGGQSIYEQAMPKIDRIYLTRVHTIVDGDTFFKYVPAQWRVVHSEKFKVGDENPFAHDFMILERKNHNRFT